MQNVKLDMIKRNFNLLFLSLFSVSSLLSQPPQVIKSYSVSHMELPAGLDKQVCISGMKYFNGNLCLVSERCPNIFLVNPVTKTISGTINMQLPQEFEMEGITSYKDNLYLVSENIAAVYEVNSGTGKIKQIETSKPLPAKTKNGDGMEGIAANEKNNKFYLLRERNEGRTKAQIFSYNIKQSDLDSSIRLDDEYMIELPLETDQWRYSDICYDSTNSRLICLKSHSKGKLRQLYIESITIDENGNLLAETLKNIPTDNLTLVAAEYKAKGYSTNLEGITIDQEGNLFIVSDNTSGKAICDLPSKEKTIMLRLSIN